MGSERRSKRGSVLQEAPKVGTDGKVRGLGCGERVKSGADGRRFYKDRAHRKARRVSKVEVRDGR